MKTISEPVTIPLVGVFAQLLGAWYPKDYLVASIAPVDGPQVVQALIAGGFGADSVELHDSARVCQIGAAIYAQPTPIQRAGAAVARAITDEGLFESGVRRRRQARSLDHLGAVPRRDAGGAGPRDSRHIRSPAVAVLWRAVHHCAVVRGSRPTCASASNLTRRVDDDAHCHCDRGDHRGARARYDSCPPGPARRRRSAWELDRAAWRLWMVRP